MPIKFPLNPQIKSIKVYADINIHTCIKDKSTNYQTIIRYCLFTKKKAWINSSFTANILPVCKTRKYFTASQMKTLFYSFVLMPIQLDSINLWIWLVAVNQTNVDRKALSCLMQNEYSILKFQPLISMRKCNCIQLWNSMSYCIQLSLSWFMAHYLIIRLINLLSGVNSRQIKTNYNFSNH